jgi:hypothetical protein
MIKTSNYFLALLVFSLSFAACKKDDSVSNNEFYFKYTVNGKTGGSTSGTSTSIFSIPNMDYSAMATSVGILTAFKSSDCNVNGNAACYNATLSLQKLSKGTHNFSSKGNMLLIYENQGSLSKKTYWISVSDGVGGGTVNLTEVGDVGGVVAGTFSGKAGYEDGSNGNTSEVTITGSFRLPRKL